MRKIYDVIRRMFRRRYTGVVRTAVDLESVVRIIKGYEARRRDIVAASLFSNGFTTPYTSGQIDGDTKYIRPRAPWDIDSNGRDPLKAEIIDGIRRCWEDDGTVPSVYRPLYYMATPRNRSRCLAENRDHDGKWFLLSPPKMMAVYPSLMKFDMTTEVRDE